MNVVNNSLTVNKFKFHNSNIDNRESIDSSTDIKYEKFISKILSDLEKLNDKLAGLRREKKEIIKILNKIKELEWTKQDVLVVEFSKLCKTESKLKNKLLDVFFSF